MKAFDVLKICALKNGYLSMSETHNAEWESPRNGERTEIGLVQVDIVEHSRIKASERNLKKAKDIFSDEIEGIAVAHGGKLFKWEGDGGSFMFLLKDGENFNRLVKAALVMLESMPAINKKIADETDLKDSIRVRLSCDSGIAEFDKNPTRIAADFINSFIKNEKKISLADNVCITERVYKQLDAQLRARFSLYKHSNEIRSDIYSLTRHKPLLRWKYVALLLLIGMILGLLCAAILAYVGWVFSFRATKPLTSHPTDVKGKPPVSMVGSGTVYRYLTDLGLFKDLENDKKNVSVLEGPTGAGAALAFNNPEPSTVLVMAAERLTREKLKEYTKGPGDIYEIYLGSDPFEVLFAIGGERNLHRLEEDNFFIKEKHLTREKLLNNWGVEKFDIYVGAEGSGARNRWERYLFDGNMPEWWSHTKTRDIRINQILNNWKSDSKPRIYLGTTALNKGDNATLNNQKIISSKVLPLFEGEKEVKGGLYLYGWIDTNKLHGKGKGDGYNLEPSVVEVLRYVFNSLRDVRPEALDPDCLEEQIEFFHLRPKEPDGEGWIPTPSDADSIHRPKTCKDRIE